jgi:hypothetical protein
LVQLAKRKKVTGGTPSLKEGDSSPATSQMHPG